MGQSHSSEASDVTPHNQSKRRSFLISTKKLIRIRRQHSHENSGASQQSINTQTPVVGEKDYHKTADRHGMYRYCASLFFLLTNKIKTKQHAYHFFLSFIFYTLHSQLFCTLYASLLVLISISWSCEIYIFLKKILLYIHTYAYN